MKSRFLAPCLAGALLTALPAGAAAQRMPSDSDSLPAYRLEGLTVTSRRTPTLLVEAPQKVEVVTRSDLDRTLANDFADALKKNTSVDVIQYTGLLAGVAIRGFRPQISGTSPRTLILVDGRPAGATNLATLDPSAMERVEVLKGPASALYGSSAMGGVVNVITRASSGAVGGRVTARYGSFGMYRAEVTAGGSLAPALDFDLSLAATGQEGGYRLGRNRILGGDSISKTLIAGGVVRIAEVDADSTLSFSDYHSRAGTLRLGYALGGSWRLGASGSTYLSDDVENPGDLAASYDSRSVKDLARYDADAVVTGTPGRHSVLLRGYSARESSAYYGSAEPARSITFRTPTRWFGAQLQDAISLGAHTVTAGVDYAATHASSEAFGFDGSPAAPFSPNSSIYSGAAFGEMKLAWMDRRLITTLGGRFDRVTLSVDETELLPAYRANSETHAVFNPSAGLVYRTDAGISLRASAGRAFVTPDAFNVAGYAEIPVGATGVVVTRGNPDLDPESSVSWDAGVALQRPAAGLDAELTYFHTDVADRIATVREEVAPGARAPSGQPVLGSSTYRNVDEAEVRGLELALGYDLGALASFSRSMRLFASGTRILRAEETSAGVASDVKNVADLTAVFGAEYDDLRRFAARLSGRYVGERKDSDFTDFLNPGDVRLPDFLVFDLSASLRLASRYRLGAALANLTDENYYEVRGYNLPGRALQLHLGVEW